MTLPSGGNFPPISLNDINTEFGYGLNLNAYRGKLFGRANNTAGVFSSGLITVADFYATAKCVAGGPISPGTTTITIPPYVTITFNVTGGGGGQQGATGVYVNGPAAGSATPAGNGGAGSASSFGSIISSAGGAANGGAATPQTVTLTNPLLGGTGPASGSTLAVTVGAGGAGGSGGPIYGWNGSIYVLTSYAAAGANGTAGAASYSWTGQT